MLKLVAILRDIEEEQALRITEIFLNSGISAVEVTYNSPNASGIISRLKNTFKDELLIGAGTVLNIDQVASAQLAGASFVLSPDCNQEVIKATKQAGLYSVPGGFTATEIMKAINAGADMVKLFPAGRLGPAYLKDMLGPLDSVKFMVVGGIDQSNLDEFYKSGAVAAGIGSSLVNKNLIKAGKYKELSELAKQFASFI